MSRSSPTHGISAGSRDGSEQEVGYSTDFHLNLVFGSLAAQQKEAGFATISGESIVSAAGVATEGLWGDFEVALRLRGLVERKAG